MSRIESKIAEKIVSKIDIEELTNKIAEKVAEKILERDDWQKQQMIENINLLKEWFEDIAEKCEHLTSGNVSHNGKMIRGFARNCAEYIETDLLLNNKSSWQKTIKTCFETGRQSGIDEIKHQIKENAITATCFGFQVDEALFSIHLPSKNYLPGSQIKVLVINDNKN